MKTRLRAGDLVTLEGVPGLWRVHSRDGVWVNVTGQDFFAKTLASLSPTGIVGFRRKEVNQQTGETSWTLNSTTLSL